MKFDRPQPGPGQESVWDYPRPPRIEDSTKHVRVIFGGVTVADTRRARRVLETSSPPVYYIPLEDVRTEHLARSSRSTFCEWKGRTAYHTVVVGDKQAVDAAWSYPNPTEAFAVIKDYIAFYPGKVDECYVDGERVRPQPGAFYGGWITNEILGPFKGEPGTEGW